MFKPSFSRLYLAAVLAVLAVTTHPVAAATPQQDLKSAIDPILGILADQGMNEATKREKIGTIVDGRFDYRAMSQRVLTVGNWKKADSKQKARFADLFGDLLKQTYFKAISAYSDQTVDFTSERIKGKNHNLAVVKTNIVSPDKRIPVEYSMRLRKDGWFIYDVKVEGVSLVRSHQSTFRNVFKNEGMAGAIKTLEEKVQEKQQPAA